MKDENLLGARLKKAREAKKLTIREFAKIIGIHYTTITRLENGGYITYENGKKIEHWLEKLGHISKCGYCDGLGFRFEAEEKDFFKRISGVDKCNSKNCENYTEKGEKFCNKHNGVFV